MAQEVVEGSISGIVLEHVTGEPMEFVNVVLIEQPNETHLEGTITSKDGRFEVAEIPIGTYFLEVSFIGFKTERSDVFSITIDSQKLELDGLVLEFDENLLEEVEVTADRSTYNLAIDRKIYNVEKDILSQTSSATEILQNLPSVSVDVNGKVSLRGTSNITFFINGKPSALMRANSTAYLQSLPASAIQRIEVITNPSAKYKPDGAGGIINIVLREESGKGWNGTVLASVGNLNHYNGNVSLNHGMENINSFVSYNYRQAQKPEQLIDHRISKDGNGQIVSNSLNKTSEIQNKYAQIINAGVDFSIGGSSHFGLAASYYFGHDDTYATSLWHIDQEFPSDFFIKQTTDEVENEFEIGATFEHEFGGDKTLAIDFNYASYNETEDLVFIEERFAPSMGIEQSKNRIAKGGPIAELAIAFTKPVGEESEIEIGYAGQFLQDDLRYLAQDLNKPEHVWMIDLTKTNDFLFTQNIHAFYATLSHSFNAFSFLAGLRAEQALVNSDLVATGREVPNNYFKMYPTIHLAYELGENQELQFSYSRRVNRADSDEHNPFPEYKDPRNREAGNPLLKPEQIHSLELGYRLQREKFTFIPSLYYRSKYDAFTEFREIVENNILHTSYVNLSRETSAGLELIITTSPLDALSVTFSSNAFYNEIDASDLKFLKLKSAISWNSKLAVNANITKSTLVQLNTHYRSSQLSAQGKSRPLFLVNLGFRQDVLKNRGSLTFTISDLFASLEWHKLIDTPELYRSRSYKRNQQIFYLGFNYRIGQSYKTDRQDLDFEDTM